MHVHKSLYALKIYKNNIDCIYLPAACIFQLKIYAYDPGISLLHNCPKDIPSSLHNEHI